MQIGTGRPTPETTSHGICVPCGRRAFPDDKPPARPAPPADLVTLLAPDAGAIDDYQMDAAADADAADDRLENGD